MSTVQHPILLLWNGTKRRCHCYTSTVWYHCSQTVPYLQELPEPDNIHSRSKVMNFMWPALGEQTGLLCTSVSFLVDFIWPCIFFSLSFPRRQIYRSHVIYFAKGRKEIWLIWVFIAYFKDILGIWQDYQKKKKMSEESSQIRLPEQSNKTLFKSVKFIRLGFMNRFDCSTVILYWIFKRALITSYFALSWTGILLLCMMTVS